MRRPHRALLVTLAAVLPTLAACGSSPAPPALPSGAPAASTLPGALSDARMRALLLQPGDLPGMTLRPSVDPAAERTSTPQLALCRPPAPVAPHQVANVFATAGKPGQAVVFEVVSVYPDAAAARAAFEQDLAAATACPAFSANGVRFTVAPPTPVAVAAVPGAQVRQYHLVASNVVSGDVRTLGLRGRYTVLLSGYGQPPGGSSLQAYQARIAPVALRRLPSS